jgi:hypothetical protein
MRQGQMSSTDCVQDYETEKEARPQQKGCRVIEGESVNTSQMDINRKTCDIRTWKSNLFLDISSVNIGPLVALPVRRNPQHREVF